MLVQKIFHAGLQFSQMGPFYARGCIYVPPGFPVKWDINF